ncbi:MAG: non-canonical purine NTP pyrophosphatase [Candidatus Nanohaloarchaeota archaeon QJJ-7]|nr:non-canonical purine NTP pyrophosphatase [Candidatus Nanohaloarchaeota archaeon QJJ-7]
MKLNFATSNSGKVKDAQEILQEFEVKQLDLEAIEPCVDSLSQISRSKVEQAKEKLEEPVHVFADDSGLFVETLDGFPGTHTSLFDDKVGKENLLELVDTGTEAEFRTAVALRTPEGQVEVFEGTVSGTLVEPRGDSGFGYDPMFLPDGHDKTFAEDMEYKHEVSHRNEALKKMREWLEDEV